MRLASALRVFSPLVRRVAGCQTAPPSGNTPVHTHPEPDPAIADTTPGAITDQVFEPLVAGDPETGAPTGVDHVTVEAYDNYWNGRPKIDALFSAP